MRIRITPWRRYVHSPVTPESIYDQRNIQSVPIVTTDHEIVILRAPLLSVLSNRGLTAAATIVAFTVPQFKPGTILVDIVPQADIDDSVNHVMVGIGGSIRVRLTKGLPRVSSVPFSGVDLKTSLINILPNRSFCHTIWPRFTRISVSRMLSM